MSFRNSELSKADLDRGLKLFSKVDYDNTSQEDLKEEIKLLEKMKITYWKLYKEYDERLKSATESLQDRCIHDFVVDKNTFEIDRTSYVCKNCGK
jgi:hypothetical protein